MYLQTKLLNIQDASKLNENGIFETIIFTKNKILLELKYVLHNCLIYMYQPTKIFQNVRKIILKRTILFPYISDCVKV